MPPPLMHFQEVSPDFFLYLTVQNLAASSVRELQSLFCPANSPGPVSKKEEGTEIVGTAVSETAAFGARQSERFLRITALTPFLNLGWFLPQGK